jgi:signal transduction histidine kinase/ActR/RegA family two-component response regulator
LNECYNDVVFSTAGIDLLSGLPYIPPAVFEDGDPLFWHQNYTSHPLNEVLASPLEKFPVNSALFFPFAINGVYIGVWLVAFNREFETPPAEDEKQMFAFLFYVMAQLIEKKAFIEQTRKYENYLKHLERMKVLGELSGATAHNLNNILSVIMGKAELLQRRLKNSPYHRDLQLLLRAAQDGADSIRRLQEYSVSGKASEEPKIINMNHLIREVVDIARPRFESEAQSHGIYYDLQLSLGEIKPITGDATTLREVMLNLINNALEAMPGGGKLSIQTTLKDNQVLIFVSDTGCGIDPEISAKIFEPFYTTKGEKGNGLGLSIAAEIIERHQGKIYVDSIPNKGAIFMIELPACGEEILPQTPPPELFHPLTYKVLLVEDKNIVRETLAEMLEDEGCEVRAVSNAQEALAEFQKSPCDVVFADLSMPQVNGVELAQRLKEIDPAIPVFIITGWSQLEKSLLDSDSVDGLIQKPFNMERIRQEMVRVIGSKTGHFYRNGFSV